jgi:hypothetical protein
MPASAPCSIDGEEQRFSAWSWPRDFTGDVCECNSSSTIPSMQRNDDTIRDFASQILLDELVGNDDGPSGLRSLRYCAFVLHPWKVPEDAGINGRCAEQPAP